MPRKRVASDSVAPLATPVSVSDGAVVSSTKLPSNAFATLPAASRATMVNVCVPSALPSSA